MADENVTATSAHPLPPGTRTPLLDPHEPSFAARLAGAQLVPLHADGCGLLAQCPGGALVGTACTCGREAGA